MKGVSTSKRNNGCWKIVINVVKNGKKKSREMAVLAVLFSCEKL